MNTPNWESITSKLKDLHALSREEAQWSMRQMMSGETKSETLKEFLLLMNEKSPTVTEISGLVDVMLENATKIQITQKAVDIVGTGGDKSGTINISTASALVVAAGGVPVIKHGNRAASSKTGSADVLEALGLNLNLTSEKVAESLEANNITFCFAPVFHPAMKNVAHVRKELNIPTVFNILGPLANPAQPIAQATGVANEQLAPLMAKVFAERGTRAIVMRGLDGLDEMSISADTEIWDARSGKVENQIFQLAKLGLSPAPMKALRGGAPSENAEKLTTALAGKAEEAVLNSIALNAAAGFVAFDTAEHDIFSAMQSGFEKARDILASAEALELLTKWISWSQKNS